MDQRQTPQLRSTLPRMAPLSPRPAPTVLEPIRSVPESTRSVPAAEERLATIHPYLTTAAANLALHLAESGQLERARQMTQMLPPDQRAEVLAKIEAWTPPQPLTATASSAAPTVSNLEEPAAARAAVGAAMSAARSRPFPSRNVTPLRAPASAPVPAPEPSPEISPEVSSETSPEASPETSPEASAEAPVEAPVEDPIALAAVPIPVIAPPSQPAVLAPAEVNLQALVPTAPARLTPELPPPPETLAYASKPPVQAPSSMIFPLAAAAPVTSPFGWRTHPISGSRRFHAGTDFGAPQGTPVLAAMGGQIKRADWAGGYGLAVEIEHQDGTLDTFYAHLSQVMVQKGDSVEQGTVVGHVGTTGYSTGPHLHFEVRRKTDQGWVEVDPMAELESQPRAEQPAPAQPEAPVAELPEAAPAVAPAPSTQPTPESSLSQVPELKGAMASASNATASLDLPAPLTTPNPAAPRAPAQPEAVAALPGAGQ
ncbi:MAG: peptidoglycan DD-metalloendopeptidase family protein [Cyanobacteria bacterium Co-bin13]|nr:peptidoglycan DD-metalloendopeptidase family protein [Cyanobacteria bacterium Co-bin13]